MRVLVVNTGSSSLKLHVLDPDDHVVTARHIEDWDGQDVGPIAEILDDAGPVDAVGHRVVHGGDDRTEPTLVDGDVIQEVRGLTPLAPLHQGRALAGITAAQTAAPDVPHVACFDTAYHAAMPEAARTYALPAEWRRRWPLRRYGFHGLSHAYAARRAGELVPVDRNQSSDWPTENNAPVAGAQRDPSPLGPGASTEPPSAEIGPAGGQRMVSCHLGAGASLCASLGGRSVDTTMGFTPLEGLVMATRSGTIDPGLVLWLISEVGLAPEEVRDGLERSSGLAGLAGTSDMREIHARRQAGDDEAHLAFDVYVHSLSHHVGAMTAALGGLDVLVFTGGVGEHDPEVRAATAARLGYLGVAIDTEENTAADRQGDRDITAAGASVSSLLIEAREDLEIARQTRALLSR